MQQKFYLYMYYDPRNNLPFYVGKGKMGSNRHLTHLNTATNKWNVRDNNDLKLNRIKKILKLGRQPIIKIIFENISNDDAIYLEKSYIKLFGRIDLKTGILTNLTEGGDGNVNWTPSLRNKISRANKGKVSVKDEFGKKFKVENDDPRWLNGELVGQNKDCVNSNINGKLTGYILARDNSNAIFRVKPDDPRWLNGELVGFNKGKPAHPNTVEAAKSRKGSKKSPESVKRGADKLRNIPKNETHRARISETMKNKPDIECIYCHCILRPSSLGIHMKKSHPEHWIPSKTKN